MKKSDDFKRTEFDFPIKSEKLTNDFWKQYQDPRWQKKRLKIMERDNFRCKSCQSTDETLNIHHIVPYRRDTKIWEYEDNELITLCEICHSDITKIIDYCKLIIMDRCRSIESALEIEKIIGEIDGMNSYKLQAVWKLIREAKKLK